MSDFSKDLVMKRILLAMTFAALLLSCGKPISSENTLENPRFVQYAGQLVPQNGTLQYVEMTESGLYVAAMPGGTKGGPVGELLKYYTGTYTVSGDVYSLGSFGTLQFSNTASGEVDLTYTIGGTTETVKAKLTKATTTGDIYRSWMVSKTRVSITSGSTVSVEFTGCNFKDIADFFRKNGYVIEDDIPASHTLHTVSVTAAGSLLLVYADGDIDLGSCVISGNSLTYLWNEDDMGYSFETGKASYTFEDGRCILSLDAKLDGATAAIKLVLREMK